MNLPNTEQTLGPTAAHENLNSHTSLTELVDHIEATHHAYLHEEIPRLAALASDVVHAHGNKDPRLREAQQTFVGMAIKLWCHMLKEEQCLFPRIRQIEANDQPPSAHCENVSNPIRQMEVEHDDAGSALNRLRELTDGFSPPEWACKKYRSLLAGFAYLERDMQRHIDKEDNVLFPSALKLEARRQVRPGA